MRILVDVYDPTGTTKQGEGPVMTCLSASVKRVLDGAGTITLKVAYADKRAYDLLQLECQVKIYLEQEDENNNLELRLFGQGILRSRTTTVTDQGIITTFSGPDSLDALTRYTVRLNRSYENETLETICDDLVTLVPGWSVDFETTDIANSLQTARFAGSSVLKALLRIVEEKGLHLRLSSTADKTIEIGAFGTDTGLLMLNSGSITREMHSNRGIILVDDVKESENTRSIVNRIIPIGAGEGQAALTLAKCTRIDPYTIQTDSEPDGTTLYYLQDDDSVAEYGVIEKVVTFKEIGPVANSNAAKQYAANALYDAAIAWLQRNCWPVKTYDVGGLKQVTTIQAGDTIRLRYVEQADTDAGLFYPLDIDESLWVMSVNESVATNGMTLSLQVSTVDVVQQDGASIIVGALESLTAQNVAVKTYPAVITSVGYDTMRAGLANHVGYNAGKYAHMELRINDFVTDITKVELRFITLPDHVTGRTLLGSSGYQTIYDIVTSPNYPSDVVVLVNNADVTSELGGPWNPSGGNNQVDETVDITEYILNASGGIYQNHQIDIHCGSRFGDARLSSPDLTVTTEVSLGWVFMQVYVFGTVQNLVNV